MERPPGRPCKVKREVIVSAILKNHLLLRNNNTWKSKFHEIWNSISIALKSQISGHTLYSMACQKGIRNEIITSENGPNVTTWTSSINDSIYTGKESSINEDTTFVITANKSEFAGLINDWVYRRRNATRKKSYERICKVLRPGLRQEWIIHKIWDKTRIKCAFNFRNHKLNNTGTAGKINDEYELNISRIWRYLRQVSLSKISTHGSAATCHTSQMGPLYTLTGFYICFPLQCSSHATLF